MGFYTDSNGDVRSDLDNSLVNGGAGTGGGSSGGGGGGTGAGGVQTTTSPGGNLIVLPSFVDFSQLVAPFVDYSAAFDFAQGIGRDNRDTYFRNLTSEQTRNSALDLVRTDLTGIQMGLDTLVPRVRREGEQDQATNIGRASQIDQFNFSRSPNFNQFNRGQVDSMNQFNRAEREESIQASGLDYRDRITKVLDQLSAQSEGRLSDDTLDSFMTRANFNRGADIASASGVGPFSGAGRNAGENLDYQQRIGLMLDAQKTIPGVLTQGQAVLQPPEELLRTGTATPTEVPFNVSNIADRIPVTSNISAGAAQQQIGTTATELEVIPATTALTTKLGTEQFNETGRFNRDIGVLDRQQAQLTATDAAVAGGFQEDKGDEIRAEQADLFQQGLDQRRDAANLGALSSIGGAILGSPVAQGAIGAAGGFLGGVAGGIFDAGAAAFDSVFGDGDGRVTVGGTEVSSDSIRQGLQSWFGGTENAATAAATGQAGQQSFDPASTGYDLSTGPGAAPPTLFGGTEAAGAPATPVSSGASRSLAETFKYATEPLRDAGVDGRLVLDSALTFENWNDLNPVQQAQASGNLGTQIAENRGLISGERAQQVNTASSAIGTAINSQATDSQRATALGTMGVLASQQGYGGTLSEPTTIGGVNVIGSQMLESGESGFLLEDGTTVPQSDLLQTANSMSAVQAFGVVTGNADRDTKLAALTATGLDAAAANGIIDQVSAGYPLAALSLLMTGRNFNQMGPISQAAALMQTTNLTYGAINSATSGALAANTGASVLALPGGATVGGVTAGAATGYAQFTGAKKFLSGDADQTNYFEQAALFTMSGGTSVIPTIEKFVGGGGKSTGRKLRDGWRGGLREAGIVDEKYNVTLADGSKYDLGLDDNAVKLTNAEGKERRTYDIDWDNKLAKHSVPDAHLFAIATGLDPTSSSKASTFDRVTAQIVNAATSNAKSADGVHANFRSMMSKFTAPEIGARIETLRLTDKISEQEYGVYLDRINKMYGTDYQPMDRGKAQQTLARTLRGQKGSESLLEEITNVSRRERNRMRLDQRLAA